MKAAIIRAAGAAPVYGDLPEPHPGPGQRSVSVTAAAISQVVKSRASGTHYSTAGLFPFVIGIDGVGRLDDGRRVYFVLPPDPHGSMAERTIIDADHWIAVPDGLDDMTAAAIANPGMSSWAAYTERARLEPGETVLVNGATGSSGRLAVQIARHLGAARIIATGRDAEALEAVAALGADVTVQLTDDPAVDRRLEQQFGEGVDVVIDYLWGRSAERLLTAAARAAPSSRPLRYVEVGSASGAGMTLPAAVLRASAIELMGSGIGSVPFARLLAAIDGVLQAAAPAGFRIAFTPVPLADVGTAWPLDDSARRTVFTLSP